MRIRKNQRVQRTHSEPSRFYWLAFLAIRPANSARNVVKRNLRFTDNRLCSSSRESSLTFTRLRSVTAYMAAIWAADLHNCPCVHRKPREFAKFAPALTSYITRDSSLDVWRAMKMDASHPRQTQTNMSMSDFRYLTCSALHKTF